MRRVLTALALIPFVAYVVLWANHWIFLAVLLGAAFLSYREYDAIAAAYGFGPPGLLGYAAGIVLMLCTTEWWLPMAGLVVLALILSMRTDDLAKALPRAALLVLGVVYVFACWKCAIPLRERSPHWLMYALILNWAGDIGAYYVGRRFGAHKLAPRVSPKKSQEGAVASVVTSVLIAGAYLVKFLPSVPLWHAIALTAAANIAGQLGDLTESAMKRGAGVKDSGAILPGHGGFLDRVDSTLFALPVVYGYLVFVAAR